MKIKLTNRKNNNTEIFDDITIDKVADFVNRELRLDDENQTGFVYLYKTLGELSFQTEEIQRYIIDGLNYSVSQATEPNEKDRYNLYLLRLLNNIDDIVSSDYNGEYEDVLAIDNKEGLIEGYANLNYTIGLTSFLNQLDIDLVVVIDITELVKFCFHSQN